MIVGVLALQGDFKEHLQSLERAGVRGVEIRDPKDLSRIDAIILPGGESTTMSKLLVSTGLDMALRKSIEEGMPTWGTCAGAILLAKRVESPTPLDTNIGLMDVTLLRNAYGRQTESAKVRLALPYGSSDVMFIRAPRVVRKGRGVSVLSEYKGDPVLLRQKHLLLSTFHNELSEDNQLLDYFLKEVIK